MPARIAILGWGSLIWNQGDLPTRGDWKPAGPVLPIEFSRISRGPRLTLVIDQEHGEPTRTRYILSSRAVLSEAVEDLRAREGTTIAHIGSVELEGSETRQVPGESGAAREAILEWAKSNPVDAVVWTDLPSNFEERENKVFSVDAALHFLNQLQGKEKAAAIEYIRNAPIEVDTPLRRAFEDMNGHED